MLSILVIVGIAAFTYVACWHASRNASLSTALTLGWVISSQGEWTQLSHHWMTTLSLMICMAVIVGAVIPARGSFVWTFGAGLAGGTGAMITPTRGALVLIAAFFICLVVRRRFRIEIAAFLLGTICVPALLVVGLIVNGSLTAAFESIVRFPAARYAAIQYQAFGFGANPQNGILVVVFPLFFALTLLVLARGKGIALKDWCFTACVAFGVAGFVGNFPRPDIVHIGFTVPLALPLITYSLTALVPQWTTRRFFIFARFLYAIIVFSVLLPSLKHYRLAVAAARSSEVFNTAAGKISLSPDEIGDLLKRIEAIPSTAPFLFYPYNPLLPYLAAKQHVSRMDIFVPGYTSPEQYAEGCVSAIHRAEWLVIDHHWTDPANLQLYFPSMVEPSPREKAEFEEAMDQGFEFVSRDGSYELRRRKQSATDALCEGIFS
jgi:hypothetical protein